MVVRLLLGRKEISRLFFSYLHFSYSGLRSSFELTVAAFFSVPARVGPFFLAYTPDASLRTELLLRVFY